MGATSRMSSAYNSVLIHVIFTLHPTPLHFTLSATLSCFVKLSINEYVMNMLCCRTPHSKLKKPANLLHHLTHVTLTANHCSKRDSILVGILRSINLMNRPSGIPIIPIFDSVCQYQNPRGILSAGGAKYMG